MKIIYQIFQIHTELHQKKVRFSFRYKSFLIILKNLKYNLEKKQLFTNELSKADIILFNGHQNIFRVLFYKIMYPNKTFIHRFDGPMQNARLIDNNLDNLYHQTTQQLSDSSKLPSALDMGDYDITDVLTAPYIFT